MTPQKPAMTDPDLPEYLTLLWNGEVDRPGPKRGVNLREVAAAGIRLADANGLAGMSMRAVAAELGFTPMALYRYVSKKDELVAIMVDEAFGAPPAPTDGDWRERVADWARRNRDVLLEHRWVLQVSFESPPLTPHQIAWMEAGLDALAELDLEPQAALSSMLLVDVYVRGQTQLMREPTPGSEAADALYAARLGALIDPDRLPRVAASLSSGALSDDDGMVDEFEFGLQTVLDGIAARRSTRG